jgi:hypothetical protein
MAVWAGLSYPVVTQLPMLGALAGVDLALLAMWLAVVREPWVREAAWIYAERLLDQVERLDAQRESGTARLSVTRPASGPVEAMRSPVPPTVAVLTALACELAAVTAVLRQARPIVDGPAGDPNHYLTGFHPSPTRRAGDGLR